MSHDPWTPSHLEFWLDDTEQVVYVHPENEGCGYYGCTIHAPSQHKMRDWPRHWNQGHGMERICPHGLGHPDPDHLSYALRRWGSEVADRDAEHSCDGCCTQTSAV